MEPTDPTEASKAVSVPTPLGHRDHDQIVPIADSAPLAVTLLTNGTPKILEKSPNGT